MHLKQFADAVVGVDSFGMCCAEAELGIGSDDEGIMDIKEPVTIGADIKSVWPVDDVVLEIDNKSLTNRPDLWGHYGIAREFSAIFDRPLKKLPVANLEEYSKIDHADATVGVGITFYTEEKPESDIALVIIDVK